jgi:hypothetical protein
MSKISPLPLAGNPIKVHDYGRTLLSQGRDGAYFTAGVNDINGSVARLNINDDGVVHVVGAVDAECSCATALAVSASGQLLSFAKKVELTTVLYKLPEATFEAELCRLALTTRAIAFSPDDALM